MEQTNPDRGESILMIFVVALFVLIVCLSTFAVLIVQDTHKKQEAWQKKQDAIMAQYQEIEDKIKEEGWTVYYENENGSYDEVSLEEITLSDYRIGINETAKQVFLKPRTSSSDFLDTKE